MWSYNNQSELYHHGILGMKWGHRSGISGTVSKVAKVGTNLVKAAKMANTAAENRVLSKQEKKGPINSNYSRNQRLTDQGYYGTKGVRQISKRMDKGKSYNHANAIQAGKSFVKHAAIATVGIDLMSGGALHKAGMNAVSKFMASEAARRSVIKIAQNSKFNPIDVAYTIVG